MSQQTLEVIEKKEKNTTILTAPKTLPGPLSSLEQLQAGESLFNSKKITDEAVSIWNKTKKQTNRDKENQLFQELIKNKTSIQKALYFSFNTDGHQTETECLNLLNMSSLRLISENELIRYHFQLFIDACLISGYEDIYNQLHCIFKSLDALITESNIEPTSRPQDPKIKERQAVDYLKLPILNLGYQEISREFSRYFSIRATRLTHAGFADLAVRDVARALELTPDFFFLYLLRSQLFQAKGEITLAIQDLSKSISLNGSYSYAYYLRGELYLLLKQWEKAVIDFNRAEELNPQPEIYLKRGSALNALGRRAEAMSDMKQALEFDQTDDYSHEL